VLANMVGAGVFLSTGYMAQEMGPLPILLAWVAGALLALAGARAYAELAVVVPRSGGEYRYLGHFLHPSLGYLAGWGSLVLGFAAPVAVDTLGAGAFLAALGITVPVKWLAAGLVLLLAGLQLASGGLALRAQNLLVASKVVLVLGFVGVGLWFGRSAWPAWTPPSGPADGGFPWQAFFANQVWIAFAFSGWNAAVYVSGEFEHPARDVPWVVLVGCTAVGVLYLLVNWVFVANLTPAQASAVMAYETNRITLGHMVMDDLLGHRGGVAMSVLAAAALVSSTSAMLLVGPRVFAAMAADGVLPPWLAAREGHPPRAALLLQAGLSVVMVFTQHLRDLVAAASGALLCFSALTVLTLFRVARVEPSAPRPSRTGRAAALLFATGSGGLFLQQLWLNPFHLRVMGALGVLGMAAWWTTARGARATPAGDVSVQAQPRP
jgi:APA family basic amino acid/polyamine antiporter